MSLIATGFIVNFLLFIATFVSLLVHYYFASKGRKWAYEMRPMPQVQAISDGIDRAVEQGKPVHISVGDQSYLSGLFAVMTIAGMNVYRYTLRLCVRKGARPIIAVPWNPECLPLMDGIFREVATAEKKPEMYKRDDMVYFGATEGHHSIGWTATILREGCACIVEVGAMTGGGCTTPIGFARDQGALVIGGTGRWIHQGTWCVLGDYPLFMEDIYAAGASVTGDPTVQSTQVSGDPIKLAIIVLIAVLTALTFAGVPSLSWLKM